MKRTGYKKYFAIGAVLFLLLTLPIGWVESVRGGTIALLSVFLKGGKLLAKNQAVQEERLETENYQLRLEIGKLRALLEQKSKASTLLDSANHSAFSSKRVEEMHFLSSLVSQAVPARVIYRDPAHWSSSCWVNVGEETNKLLNRPAIQKNSPVLIGRSIVGVIDYVGNKQSRVRLITDPCLKPSVRAVRGLPHNILLLEHIEPILRYLKGCEEEGKLTLVKQLEKWQDQLSEEKGSWYLAKGILQGGKSPKWRSTHHSLSGIGFNYDFADEEGPARELATGRALQDADSFDTQPLIQVNDLLVTTGMDGVFPPGLRVAEVTKIFPLREGAYTYEIEAVPVVGNLDTLHTVFIISSLDFDNEDRQS